MSASPRQITIHPFLLIGFITGGLLALLISSTPEGIFGIFSMKSPSLLRVFLYYWIGFYGLMFLLAYPNAKSLSQLIGITFIPSFIASLLYYWAFNQSAYAFTLLFFSSYALNAFHIHYQTNGLRLCYPTLFYAVWDTFVKMLISIFFTLLCWLILFTCAELFAFIKITFITTLIKKSWVDVWLTTIFMSIGLYIPSIIENVVRIVRMIFLHMCRYLFIPLAIISIIFIAAFFAMPEHQQFKSSSEMIFLFISYTCVLFFNGVYQDGSNENPYPTILLWISRIFLWITPIFTVLALYSDYYYGYNNIHEAGFNTGNFADFITILLLLFYNVTYAIIALNIKKNWLKAIEHSNVVLAFLVIVVTCLTTQPIFMQQLPRPMNQYHPLPSTQPKQTKTAINTGTWIIVTNNNIPSNAFIAGENEGPIYLCRAAVDGTELPGVVRNQQCHIALLDKIMRSTTFSVYIEPPQKAYWSTYYPLQNGNQRLSVGTETEPLTVCRTIYDNRVFVGFYDNVTCNFIAKGKVVHSQDKPQYLYLNGPQ